MFVYLYSEDEPLKQAVVEEIINRITPKISIQVLNELSNTLRKK
jgi:predicted nucleic acid-binding protein